MNAGRLREVVGVLLAAVLSLGAAAILTWPMVRHLDEVVMGGGELGGWLWRYDWHFRSLDAVSQAELSPWDRWRALVGLGRHPETGNILDVLAFSYPLERWFGFPMSYNLKILLLLAGNGLCGYALGRYFSGSISAALAACAIAVVNPLCILEVQASGLRQALLWWVLLYPPMLDRALRRRALGSGVLAGVCLGVAGAFYWFYGLFTGIFTLVWLVKHLLVERARLDWRGMARAVVGVGLGVALSAGPFVLPYAMSEEGGSRHDGGAAAMGGAAQLPEMTFFLPFPAYDTISHAPMRPSTYAENVLASINRTIGSSWSITYPFDPTLNESLPLVVMLFGVLPAVLRQRSWGWLGVWLFFYLGTLGPYLRVGYGDAANVYRIGDYVVRLPFVWMFQFIPGMARMFAPYRLASMVVVASVALVAMGVARFRWRAWAWPVVFALVVAQPMYRWGRGAVNEGDSDSREVRSPIKANRILVPQAYKDIDATELGGIVELPIEQQQDLLCFYQILHGQKVYRSWASPGAISPSIRRGGGGEAGERLRFQGQADVVTGPIPEAWRLVSRDPEGADLSAVNAQAVADWAKAGNYRRVILHERGYFLVDPRRGTTLYLAAVRRLAEALGVTPVESVEMAKGDPANPIFGVPLAGDLVPWTSQPTELPPDRAPSRYRMAILELPETPAAPLDSSAASMD